MRVIYKYVLEAPLGMGETQFRLPKYATVLDIQYQGEALTLWAFVDTNQTGTEPWVLTKAWTGKEITQSIIPMDHAKTIQRPSGLVEHLFISRV